MYIEVTQCKDCPLWDNGSHEYATKCNTLSLQDELRFCDDYGLTLPDFCPLRKQSITLVLRRTPQ